MTRYGCTIARTPGFWQVRAKVVYEDGQEAFSNEDLVEERYPLATRIEEGRGVEAHFAALWQQSKDYAAANRGWVTEKGCWVDYDTYTSTYSFPTDDVTEHEFQTTPGVPFTAKVDFTLYKTNFYDPTDYPTLRVAMFHTHYPITYTVGHKFTGGPRDNDAKDAKDIPAFVYDYTGYRESNHRINAPDQIYIYGAAYRETP